MFKRSLGIFISLGALIGATHAQSITFQNVGLAGTADISYNGGNAAWVYAGYLNFSGGNSLGFVNDNFAAICGDVIDNINSGQSYGAAAWDSQAYASFYGNVGVGLAGNIVAHDYTAVLSSGDGAKAEGLQLAVWEVLYDSANAHDATNPDFANDVFRAADHGQAMGSINGSVLTYANQYYGDRTIAGTAIFIKASPNGSGQDQFTMQDLQDGHHLVTPEPFTMSLGLAGIGLFVRRRMKAKKA